MRAPSVLALVVLVLAACDCDRAHRTSPAPATSEESAPTEPGPEPSGEPEDVTFTTEDGITIAGTLRRGGDPSAPAVILVHRLGADRSEWAPLVEKLSEAPGLTTLAIDARGHGASTRGPSGEVSYSDFDQAAWEAASKDVVAAAEFLEERSDVSPTAIALVGSSIGSSAVIRAAPRVERLRAVVAISPGRAYHGVDAITPAAELGDAAVLTIAAEEEAPAVEAGRDIARIANGEAVVYPGSAHGMEIARESPEMLDRVVSFSRDRLSGSGS